MTTTTDRDSTPFEDRLREQLAGHDKLDALVVETYADMLALPIPPSCPSWCDTTDGHIDETQDCTAQTRTTVLRFHEQGVGDYLTVSQFETHTLADGSVELTARIRAAFETDSDGR